MFDRDRFVADCRDALARSNPEAAIHDIVRRAVAEPSQVEAALGRPQRGGTFYRRDARGLVGAGGKRLERADAALLGEKIVHGGHPRLRR